MRFARAREIGLAALLFGAPGLVRAAAPEVDRAPAGGGAVEPAGSMTSGVAAATAGPEGPAGSAAERIVVEPVSREGPAGSATAGPAEVASPEGPAGAAMAGPTTEAAAASSTTGVEATSSDGSTAPARPAGGRGRTWQIYQRPLPGAEHSWGPPNGQMPVVAEVAEELPDPHRAPPTGTARIAVGAVLGTLGLGVLGLGVAARTTDVLGADHRAGVPLIGAGLVTAAIGWGLFTHGILRRRAYLRWKGAQVTAAPAVGGATLVLRF